jgi:hypothetical protein
MNVANASAALPTGPAPAGLAISVSGVTTASWAMTPATASSDRYPLAGASAARLSARCSFERPRGNESSVAAFQRMRTYLSTRGVFVRPM